MMRVEAAVTKTEIAGIEVNTLGLRNPYI